MVICWACSLARRDDAATALATAMEVFLPNESDSFSYVIVFSIPLLPEPLSPVLQAITVFREPQIRTDDCPLRKPLRDFLQLLDEMPKTLFGLVVREGSSHQGNAKMGWP